MYLFITVEGLRIFSIRNLIDSLMLFFVIIRIHNLCATFWLCQASILNVVYFVTN
ncbi:hypothetical protein Spirs_0824 [Sediminispirochaeta smaragdinae DSM 11293]|jgi:hypothetical protein|uniref:Uncharacterized protein n=1 Tax=Sediminispirochaeta smaragdinae (strain DSM 11293 / JCM 15392 / SEBR 4228) TaxID=573413 RepID=E1RC79_SEDSS|nr:hypothetical protein Spirs_0824 [Sediminispirochaeta smaragdinae DSM 11293]